MNKYDMIKRLKDWLEQVRILHDLVDRLIKQREINE